MVLTMPHGAASSNPFEHIIFWSGEVYESELFGLSIDLPEDWQGTSIRNMSEDDDIHLLFGGRTPYFMATHWSSAGNRISIYMVYRQDTDATIESIFDDAVATGNAFAEMFSEWGFDAFDIEVTGETTIHEALTRIGAHYWHSRGHRSYIGQPIGSVAYTHTFVRIDGGIVKEIVISYRNADELKDVFAMLGVN